MSLAIDPVYAAARELRDLLPRLSKLVALETATGMDESQIGVVLRPDVHRIPWNAPAADLYFAVAADARRYESALTLLLFRHAKFRPGTDEQTLEAVAHIPVLVDHAVAQGHARHGDVEDAASLLPRWARAARQLLDEPRDDERPWTKAPGDLRCPECDRPLHLAPGWSEHPDSADVYCRRCRDEVGHMLRWAPTTWLGVLQYREKHDVP